MSEGQNEYFMYSSRTRKKEILKVIFMLRKWKFKRNQECMQKWIEDQSSEKLKKLFSFLTNFLHPFMP